MRNARLLSVAGLMAALGMAACGGVYSSGSTTHDSMNQAQAEQVGGAITNLVSGAFTAASQFDINADGSLTDPTLAPGVGRVSKQHLVAAILNFGSRTTPRAQQMAPMLDGGVLAGGSCVPTHSATIDSTYDTDKDSIPNDDILTFTPTNCNYVNGFGLTVTVTGNVEVKDIGSIWGFQIDFNNLTYSLTGPGGSGTIIVSGLYSTAISANLANTQESIHISISGASGGPIGITTSWSFSFVPGTAIGTHATKLPAGQLTLTGNFSFSKNTDNWSVLLTTPDPLVYNGTCALNPIFDSGTLEGQIAIKRTAGFRIIFNACGATPTVTPLGAA